MQKDTYLFTDSQSLLHKRQYIKSNLCYNITLETSFNHEIYKFIIFFFFRFKIAKEKNPAEKVRPHSAGGSKERAGEAGLHITCFDFSTKDHNMFVVGTVCGGLYKCILDRAVSIEGYLKNI